MFDKGCANPKLDLIVLPEQRLFFLARFPDPLWAGEPYYLLPSSSSQTKNKCLSTRVFSSCFFFSLPAMVAHVFLLFSAWNRMGECFAFFSVLALRWVGGGWWDRWDRSELWWGQRCSVTEWVWFMLSMSTPLGWTILFSLWSYWTSSGSFCRNSFILRD